MAFASFGTAYYLCTIFLFLASIGRGLEYFSALSVGWFALLVASLDYCSLSLLSESETLDPIFVPWEEFRSSSLERFRNVA